ncbi:MAG: EAL domain-containing protein [Lachnospiraceae bacterium]
MNYNIFFDISAIMLMLVILFYFFSSGQILNQRNLVFGMMIVVVFAAPILDLITIWIDQEIGTVPLVLDYILNDLYLCCGVSIAMLFYLYIRVLSKQKRRIGVRNAMVIAFPYFVALLMIFVINPFTGWIFYFDAVKGYTHGPFYDVLYLVASVYLVAALVRTIRFRKEVTNWQKALIILYLIIIFGVEAYQFYNPFLMALQYCEALSCLVLCFALENPADFRDKWLGIYNADAFREVFDYANFRKKNYQLLGIRVEGLREINEMFGTSVAVDILQMTVDRLVKKNKPNKLFSLHRGDLLVYDQKNKDEWNDIQRSLKEYFRHPITVNNVQIRLGVSLCMLQRPDLVNNSNDAIDKISFGLVTAAQNAEWVVWDADDTENTEGRRESYVIQAMKLALESNSFEVYYQPIYSVREKRYIRAEALVRLHDEQLGQISPNEFIPLAEKRGMITEIGAQVFRKVCEFLQQERLWEKGIERVDVNLSAVQCMNDKMAERMIDMMDAYKVPYKAINFEITETAAVASKENLRKNMDQLLEKGVNFSMDDYGTGYSNAMTVIDYPIAVVKLDKSMLWSAMEKPKAAQALKHTISMMKEMGLEIITEGVETLEMAEKLEMLGCNLHQGFYYSRPVREEEFLKIIS